MNLKPGRRVTSLALTYSHTLKGAGFSPVPVGVELCYQQGLPDESGLMSSPSRVDAPTL